MFSEDFLKDAELCFGETRIDEEAPWQAQLGFNAVYLRQAEPKLRKLSPEATGEVKA